MDDVVIKVTGVSKIFKLPREKSNTIKSLAVNFYKRNKGYEQQKVLKNVSFGIKRGEFFGIVGRNGSGKSTLLKLLAEIYYPSKGSVEVRGKLTPFIELGVGFNPELTGRENVFLNGALLGFNRKEMRAMYKDIVDFAELNRFMDQKLKNYSSGMQVRLAFSIAIRAKSDILLIDEVLAVGDAAFQTKCFDYFQSLKGSDTTVVFVSHDRSSLERFCQRGILINEGELIKSGPIRDVLKEYSKIVMAELDESDSTEPKILKSASPYARISQVITCDAAGAAKKRFPYGEDIFIKYKVTVKQKIDNPILGVTVFQKNVDKAIFATNTVIDDKTTGSFEAGDDISFGVQLPSGLNDGEYYVEPAVANEAGSVFFDQQPKAATFLVSGSNNPYAIFSTQAKIKLDK